MKDQHVKENYNKELPPTLFNWILLVWFILLFVWDGVLSRKSGPAYLIITIPIVLSAIGFILLALKGTNARFYFNPRTDSDGWVMRTGQTLKFAAKRLAQNYPRIIKKVRLKDSTFKVTVTKKYKYNPNPISIEEVD